EGQTMDINARKKDEITEEEYMEIITKKTGYYLAVSMIGGAIIANVQDEIIHSLVEYGKFVGPLFQIRDDMLDLTKGKGREEIGCDIREGKKSIFVVYVLSKCTKEEKNKLLEILRKGHEETTKADISWGIELFKKYDAFDYAQRKIDFLLAQAKGAVSNLPAETCKILSDFAEFMAKREF
ncbi:MAG: polyprenyl synthetase family protein, partial [Euryarchaeota archaeon]|nr:polyprenyl synthetase family protein [Euryarchaeota archaeon]